MTSRWKKFNLRALLDEALRDDTEARDSSVLATQDDISALFRKPPEKTPRDKEAEKPTELTE